MKGNNINKIIFKESDDIDELKKLIPDTCTNIELFSKGKRGVIFKAKYTDSASISCCSIDKKSSPSEIDVAIKIPLQSSKAQSTSLLEGKYLDKVNFFSIGPTVYDYNDKYVIMEFIEGELIGEWIKNNHDKEF
jgi:predicted Ser/Thr protein kinase